MRAPPARRTTRPGEPALAGALGTAALAVGGGASLAGALERREPAATGLYVAAGLLALAVLADSAVEHDRGRFRNPGMWTPLVASTAVLAGAARGGRSGPLPYVAAAGVGAAGLGFHLFNIFKRPGRLSWQNLFYAAPIGAPAALSLAGLLGLAGGAVAKGRRRIAGVRIGRALAGLSGLGLAGTVGEAALLHFRGSFQNPFMWLPVSLPPVGAALLARAATEDEAPAARPLTRSWLGLTAALGIAGVGFHVFGVHRAMGGWKNWRQNMIDGPPIPAPPAFTALAIAGLAALSLRDREARA